MKNLNLSKAILAGVLGTIAMTIFAMMAPLMGMPEMNIPKMLSGAMGLPIVAGWLAHFMVGVILAIGYAIVFSKIPFRSGAIKGMIYSLLPWLMAQLVVMPMMATLNKMPFTSGIFSGSFVLAFGSLMGHIVYGLILGLTYKPTEIQKRN
ncbi:hypothetical protein BH10BAC5_BH10BAC5_04970 [soil metagenome]